MNNSSIGTQAVSWFVSPAVVPGLMILLIVARVIFTAPL
jgi:hypothetical protein